MAIIPCRCGGSRICPKCDGSGFLNVTYAEVHLDLAQRRVKASEATLSQTKAATKNNKCTSYHSTKERDVRFVASCRCSFHGMFSRATRLWPVWFFSAISVPEHKLFAFPLASHEIFSAVASKTRCCISLHPPGMSSTKRFCHCLLTRILFSNVENLNMNVPEQMLLRPWSYAYG